MVDCRVVVHIGQAYLYTTWLIRVPFITNWLLHHGDNRVRHSANHNLLPDMHLRVPVLRVKRVMTVGLFAVPGKKVV